MTGVIDITLTAMGLVTGAALVSAAAPSVALRFLPRVSSDSLRDHIGFDRILPKMFNEGAIACLDGTLFVTIALGGLDVSSRTDEEQDTAYVEAKEWVEGLKAWPVTVRVFSSRRRYDRRKPSAKYESPVLSLLQQEWAETFADTFEVKHTVVLSVSGGTESARDVLSEAVHHTLRALGSFKPEILSKGQPGVVSPLLSFWGELLNPGARVRYFAEREEGGREEPLSGPVEQRLADSLIRSDVVAKTEGKWTAEDGIPDGVLVFRRGEDRTYMAAIGLTKWTVASNPEILTNILAADAELTVFQTFRTLDEPNARAVIEIIRKNAGLKKAVLQQLSLLGEALDAKGGTEHQDLMVHQLLIFVTGRSREDLMRGVIAVEAAIDDAKCGSVRLTETTEPAWFQQFPPHGEITSNLTKEVTFPSRMVRQMMPVSGNVAHFLTFETATKGLERMPAAWGGGAPATIFKTHLGSLYPITFHKKPENETDKPLGNAILIGAPGAGKTTLANMIATTCNGYPNAHVFMTDRYDGSYVPITAFGGRYVHLQTDHEGVGEVAELSPLQMPYSVNGQQLLGAGEWLLRWLCDRVLLVDDPREQASLAAALATNAGLPPHEQNFDELYGALTDGPAKDALFAWTRQGARGATFNGRRDTLNFEAGTTRLVGFDFTRALSDLTLVRALLPYLQYRIETAMLGLHAPWVFLVDEAAAMVADPTFLDWYMKLHQEIRKSDGVIVSCFQRANSLADVGDRNREVLLTACPLKIVFPNPDAQPRDYMDCLGLTEAEFEFVSCRHRISRTQKRVCLVKKDGEGSVITNVDLSPLVNSKHGNLLSLFESGREPSDLLRRHLRETGGDVVRAAEKYVRDRTNRHGGGRLVPLLQVERGTLPERMGVAER